MPTETQKKPVRAKTDATNKKDRYIESIGRRKTAVARVRIYSVKAGKEIEAVVNDRPIAKYFPSKKFQDVALAPFTALSLAEHRVTAKVVGGGTHAQAEAIRLGIARSLVTQNPLWRPRLKALGFLKRDPRMVERKHPGTRKARRPQQWRKR